MSAIETPAVIRCSWANNNELLATYHDHEWGVPTHDDRVLFEMLNLEGAQAGLSWLTILTRRDAYRKAFDSFDPERIARYDDAKRADLLQDTGIIRNRLKINAVIENARAFLRIRDEYGSFDRYIWSFVGDRRLTEADHEVADKMSKDMGKALKKQGFRFIGPTTCYSFMESTGMLNNHSSNCFRYAELITQTQ